MAVVRIARPAISNREDRLSFERIVMCEAGIERIGIAVAEKKNRRIGVPVLHAEPPLVFIGLLKRIALQANVVLRLFPERPHKLSIRFI